MKELFKNITAGLFALILMALEALIVLCILYFILNFFYYLGVVSTPKLTWETYLFCLFGLSFLNDFKTRSKELFKKF